MKRLAIMQGRLVPPVNGRIQAFPAANWAEEFGRAREAGLDAIEWIYDAPDEAGNPLATDHGLAEMRERSTATGVGVFSVCADYFMVHPLLQGTVAEQRKRREHLEWLIGRCTAAGIERIVLPFVDQSNVQTAGEQSALVDLLGIVGPVAGRAGVELHLEMALSPSDFADLLARVPFAHVKVNYDSGNSASLGYHVRDELEAYGDRLGSVHIKDRVRGGGTVPLGTGNAELRDLFDVLKARQYAGDLVLQVARGESGDEVRWARQNAAFVRGLLG